MAFRGVYDSSKIERGERQLSSAEEKRDVWGGPAWQLNKYSRPRSLRHLKLYFVEMGGEIWGPAGADEPSARSRTIIVV